MRQQTGDPAVDELARVLLDSGLVEFRDGEARQQVVDALKRTADALQQRNDVLAQNERMATLGTLAAGVAHELNNPSAAARRAAEQLRDAFVQLENAHQALARVEFSDERRELLAGIDRGAREHAPQRRRLSGIQRIDRESEVEDWLQANGIDSEADIATALVGQGLDPEGLDRLARTFSGPQLEVVLNWAASVYPVHTLLYEIEQSATRISEIATALRNYSFRGKAPIQAISLHDGLDDTLVILRNKLKDGIDVVREYDSLLPPVPAHAGDLNQVWTNLLDNAADAMKGKGQITIRTRVEGEHAVIEIEDNGPGIAPTDLPNVFDPFFTTKEPGKGTGLGLSTSHSIVTEKHGGTISVQSEPGATRFTVRLPLTSPIAQPDPVQ